MQNFTEQALAFIQANPKSTKNSIGDHLQLRGLPLFNLLKSMVKDGQIVANLEGQDTIYSIAERSEGGSSEPDAPTTNETKTKVELKEPIVETLDTKEEVKTGTPVETKAQTQPQAAKSKSGRNTGSFMFNGVSYNKSKLIHAVVSHYCSTHKGAGHQGITHDELKQVFPDTLMKRFGIFQTVSKGREISGAKYDRYFFKEEMHIKVKDAILVCCNQITSDNLLPFLAVAREQLGYSIDAQ